MTVDRFDLELIRIYDDVVMQQLDYSLVLGCDSECWPLFYNSRCVLFNTSFGSIVFANEYGII